LIFPDNFLHLFSLDNHKEAPVWLNDLRSQLLKSFSHLGAKVAFQLILLLVFSSIVFLHTWLLRKIRVFLWGRGEKEMAEEAFGWIFVDFIPLLCEKKKVARQLQVETWLDLSQLAAELGIDKLERIDKNARSTNAYIV
jgi:hypothetical protein